ncbi:MAG: hypothetical protein IH946_06425, partial [Bacteroidetes bacterium]|nr:hypothetical protein [Bacteroidota bacterium]
MKMGDKAKEDYEISAFDDFFARGILGQFIYVNPEKNIVIVRIGKRRGTINWPLAFLSFSEKL